MDFQHRAGGKTGTGGVASASDANRDRRERLRMLALETIDLMKVSIVLKVSVNKVAALVNISYVVTFVVVSLQDPYFMKNHLGSYECKLCLTLHNNEVSANITFSASELRNDT